MQGLSGGWRALAALALSAGVLWAAPASAQVSKSEELATSIAHDLMGAVPWDQALASSNMSFLDQVPSRPEWKDLLKQSVQEEIEADKPKFDQVFGRTLARSFTIEELQAGYNIFHGPARDWILQTIQSSASRATPTPPPPPIAKAMEKALRDPAARSFMEKLGHLDRVMGTKDFEQEIAIIMVPGVFKRFGAKAEANERAREAAQAAAPSAAPAPAQP